MTRCHFRGTTPNPNPVRTDRRPSLAPRPHGAKRIGVLAAVAVALLALGYGIGRAQGG